MLGRVKGWRRWCLPVELPDPQPQVAAGVPVAAPVEEVEEQVAAAQGSEQPGGEEASEPAVKRARVAADLLPYSGHVAVQLGRSLRCLRCFSRPVGDYRAWKRGGCLDELPPQAMPGGMPTEVLRSGGLGADTSEPAKARFTELHKFAARTAGQRPGLGMN